MGEEGRGREGEREGGRREIEVFALFLLLLLQRITVSVQGID